MARNAGAAVGRGLELVSLRGVHEHAGQCAAHFASSDHVEILLSQGRDQPRRLLRALKWRHANRARAVGQR